VNSFVVDDNDCIIMCWREKETEGVREGVREE